MINGLVADSIPLYQISAWSMAILCRGFTQAETAFLTDCMLASGSTLPRATDRPRVDKHSTGGLGDKVSLVLAPMLACFDVDVPMLSGRGLGITGGTLDKLESYTGFRCDLTIDEMQNQLRQIGCFITGTTPKIAPADRKLYALRDVTGTVPSVALITASIMSKKLAAALDALVLDVKCGSGAFMQSFSEARKLAESLCATGKRMQVATTALITDMSQPLGDMVGNACEVNEALSVLAGGGPTPVRELTLRLSAEVLSSVARFPTPEEAYSNLSSAIGDGRALRRYQEMIEMQGGRFHEQLDLARSHTIDLRTLLKYQPNTQPSHGTAATQYLHSIDGQQLGTAIVQLGGGRRKLGDVIDHRVGLEMLVHLSDSVDLSSPIIRVFCDSSSSLEAALPLIAGALTFSETTFSPPELVFTTLS